MVSGSRVKTPISRKKNPSASPSLLKIKITIESSAPARTSEIRKLALSEIRVVKVDEAADPNTPSPIATRVR